MNKKLLFSYVIGLAIVFLVTLILGGLMERDPRVTLSTGVVACVFYTLILILRKKK